MSAKSETAQQKTFAPDWWLFVTILALLTFGVVMVYDSSYPLALSANVYNHDALYFLKRQLFAAGLGLIGLYGFSHISYWRLKFGALPTFIVSIVLLVLIWKLGHSRNGSARWIALGPLNLQPSELAKFALVLFLAWLLAERPQILRQPWTGVGMLTALVSIPILLTERQPDLGTAATMFITYLILLLVAGARVSWVAVIAGLSMLAVAGTLLMPSRSHPNEPNYRMRRMIFLHPETDKEKDGYQNWHSLVALGSGGVTGTGIGQSNEKRPGGLPAQRTDFIYAIIGEETGLIGTGAVLLGFLFLSIRGFTIALRTRDPFGRYLATGLTALISTQALLNIAVVTSSIPCTGIPLPLISYGGSSLVPTLWGLGILLAISRHPFWRDGAGRFKEKERPGAEALRKAGIG